MVPYLYIRICDTLLLKPNLPMQKSRYHVKTASIFRNLCKYYGYNVDTVRIVSIHSLKVQHGRFARNCPPKMNNCGFPQGLKSVSNMYLTC